MSKSVNKNKANVINDIKKLLVDLTLLEKDIDKDLTNAYAEFDEQNIDYQRINDAYEAKQKELDDYEDENKLKDIELEHKKLDPKWYELAFESDNLANQLQETDEIMTNLENLQKGLSEDLEIINEEKKDLNKNLEYIQKQINTDEIKVKKTVKFHPGNKIDNKGSYLSLMNEVKVVDRIPEQHMSRQERKIQEGNAISEANQEKIEEQKRKPSASTRLLQSIRSQVQEKIEPQDEIKSIFKKQKMEPLDEKEILGGSRLKELLKRKKNILKRVEKILSKKKGTRKIKGGMEESSHPPPSLSSELIDNIAVDSIFTFTVDGIEGVYRVTALAQIGRNYIINSIKVGSESSPIRLYLIYNLSNGKVTVTEASTIPSSPQVTLGREDMENVHTAAEILRIPIYEARRLVLLTKEERNDPEMFRHPPDMSRGGTRKYKKSKKKGTRKMKGGMEESSHPPPSLSELIPDIAVDSIFTFTVDGVEGEYKVTKLAQIGPNYIINSMKVGSESSPIRLYLIYNRDYDEVIVTEESSIPYVNGIVLNGDDRLWINSRANEIAQSTGISRIDARNGAIHQLVERKYPERSHPIPGGTRKHKKSKKKGTRKNKKRMK
tara:strand:- start:7450 stop:9270 length:1821 start_codon:yes stop_codon:yes gene_type:complete